MFGMREGGVVPVVAENETRTPPPLAFAVREGAGVAVDVGSWWQMRQTPHLCLRQRGVVAVSGRGDKPSCLYLRQWEGGGSWWQRRQTPLSVLEATGGSPVVVVICCHPEVWPYEAESGGGCVTQCDSLVL